MSITTLDLETSTYNFGNPHDSRNFIVTAHIKAEDSPTFCKRYTEPDYLTVVREHLANTSLLVGLNLKFDLSHLANHGIHVPTRCRIWDCMLAEFILSGQTNSFASLNSLAELYGLGAKEDVVATYWDKGISTEDIPLEIVESYGNHDVELTYAVYKAQLCDARMTPALHKLILLDGLDLLVLLEMECNGFKYDKEGSLNEADERLQEKDFIEAELLEIARDDCPELEERQLNWESGDQLSAFLYGGFYEEDITTPVTKIYKSGPKKGQEYTRNEFVETKRYSFNGHFKPLRGTELKKSNEECKLYSTGADVLASLSATTKKQRHIIELLQRRAALSKLVGTYLDALPKLLDDMHWGEFIHGQFNQTVARTGRLSSSKPNMQNAPEEVDMFFTSRY